jgi:hypothetical protein
MHILTFLQLQNHILSGRGVTLEEHETALNSSDLTIFKYAPVTSCNVEMTTTDHF